MKNKLFILFFLVLSTTLIFGQSIKVTNPGSKTVLMKGQTLKITWVKAGLQNNFVKIRLFNSNGSLKILGITERTKNSGVFRWNFSGNIPDGQYIIRIKTKDNKITGNSKVFRIGKGGSVPPPPPPPPPPGRKLFSVSYPNGGEQLMKDSQAKITWNVQNVSGNLILELWKGNRKYGTIANNISVSQKHFNWTIGNTFGNAPAGKGNDYKIKILSQGIMDMSDKSFSISEDLGIPGFQDNNTFNNTATFKTFQQIAYPPVIEEIKVWSKDPNFRGQVLHGESFDVKILFKNRSATTDRSDWYIYAYLDNIRKGSVKIKNSLSPKKPGQSWWYTFHYIPTSDMENKTLPHLLKVTLGNSSKTTMMGIKKTDRPVIPYISFFYIMNNENSRWEKKAKYNPETIFEVKFSVSYAEKITLLDVNTNKILKSFKPKTKSTILRVKLTAKRTGYIKLIATSISKVNKEAKVYLISSKPLQISGKYLSFEMWRSGNDLKTRGVVQGYRSVKLIESNGRVLKKLSASDWKSSKLDWEFLQSGFPIKLTLKVTYMDYSQENITRTIK